jgi:uncharacterized protein (DUF1684 family)
MERLVELKKIMVIRASWAIILFTSLASLFINYFAADDYETKILHKRRIKDRFFAADAQSPIENRDSFQHLVYFPVLQEYRVRAQWNPIQDTVYLSLRANDGREQKYRVAGQALFQLNARADTLNVFYHEENDKVLFIPFYDSTNGLSTFAKGRYLEVPKPNAKETNVELDFNLAYTPWSAFSYRYSSVIPPKVNFVSQPLRCGERYEGMPLP